MKADNVSALTAVLRPSGSATMQPLRQELAVDTAASPSDSQTATRDGSLLREAERRGANPYGTESVPETRRLGYRERGTLALWGPFRV